MIKFRLNFKIYLKSYSVLKFCMKFNKFSALNFKILAKMPFGE